jgi:hypothetical protein
MPTGEMQFGRQIGKASPNKNRATNALVGVGLQPLCLLAGWHQRKIKKVFGNELPLFGHLLVAERDLLDKGHAEVTPPDAATWGSGGCQVLLQTMPVQERRGNNDTTG